MRRHGKTILGIVLSILLLAWALRDVSIREVGRELAQADPVLLGGAIAITIMGMAIRALRWGILLVPTTPDLPFRPRFASTVIGFAANNILPARIGEFVRAYSLGRLTRVTVSAALAALVIERILDGLVLVGLLFAAMATPAFPATGTVAGIDAQNAAAAIAALMGAAGVVLFALVIIPEQSLSLAKIAARALPHRFREPALAAFGSFLNGLASLRNGRIFLLSLVLAAAQWIFLAFSFTFAFNAFGIVGVPFAGAVFLQSLISLAVAIPSSPGFFGPYEAAAILGLGLWSVSPEKAVSFAVGLHLGGFIPVTLMGFYYVWRYGISWREVTHADEAASATPDPHV